MNSQEEFWYDGRYNAYRRMPWLHESPAGAFPMPWTVVEIIPMGYVVFKSANDVEFKMLNKPVVVAGDLIS
jgi:hypothetical protein